MIVEHVVFSMVLIFSFIIRIYLLFKYKWVGKDTFYHFIAAKTIKEKGFPPDYIDQFVKPEKYDYPPAFHLFISLIDERNYQKLQIFSPITDILTGIVIFLFANSYFSYEIAIIATTLYLVTPFVLDNSYSFNPRSFANLFFVLAVFSCINSILFNSITWFALSVIFSGFVLLLHRLTTQCLYAVLIVLAFGLHSFLPGIILLLSVLTAILMTKGFYLTVLRGHLAFISEFGHKVFDDKYRDERPARFPDPKQLFFNMPILPAILLWVYYPLNLHDPAVFSLLIWALILTVLSVIWIFGEGIRHMICSVPAFSILIALIVTSYQLYSVLLILIVVSFLFSIIKIYRLEKYPHISGIITKNMLNAFTFIKKNKKNGDILLCLPLDYSYNAAFFSDCIMLQSSGGFAEGLSFNQKLHKMVNQGKINEIIEMYHTKWVILLEKSIHGLDESLILYKNSCTFNFGESTVINFTRGGCCIKAPQTKKDLE